MTEDELVAAYQARLGLWAGCPPAAAWSDLDAPDRGGSAVEYGMNVFVFGEEPTTARDLVPDWDGVVPETGSKEELDLARRMTAALEALLRPVVEELHPWTVDPPGRRRLLRDRLTWLLLRPGRLDRA